MNKEIKYKIRIYYGMFGVPAIIIHELCHILTGLMVGYHYDYNQSWFSIDEKGNFSYSLWEKEHKKTLFKSIFNSLSPLYFVITIAILAFFSPFHQYFLVYLLLAWRFSLPSGEDWRKVRYHKKHLSNYAVMLKFFTLKGLCKEEEMEWKDEWNLDNDE